MLYCRDIELRLRRCCVFLRMVHNSYIFPSGLHFSQAYFCKTVTKADQSRMSLERWTETRFLSPFPEITITGKYWTQAVIWDGKSYALGSYAKDLWVTWNLHVTCWTQTLEKTNLLLIYVNRKLCSAIQMFSSCTLYTLIMLVFPREQQLPVSMLVLLCISYLYTGFACLPNSSA